MLYIQTIINNSSSSVIDIALNELCYDFKILDATSLLLVDSTLSIEAFDKLRLIKREEADDVIVFAFVFIKVRYDVKHLAIDLKKDNEVFLRLHQGYFIPSLFNRKLSQQRVGPFKILNKVGHLTYRL